MEIFGTEGIINMWTLIFGAAIALLGFIFRKNIANDLMDWKFSVIGSIACGSLLFIIMDVLFHDLKVSIGIGIVGWLAGGFLLGSILWDGESEGAEA